MKCLMSRAGLFEGILALGVVAAGAFAGVTPSGEAREASASRAGSIQGDICRSNCMAAEDRCTSRCTNETPYCVRQCQDTAVLCAANCPP
jgi:hypothetical protein